MNLEVEELDVKMVFLHSNLEEQIYMQQTVGIRQEKEGEPGVPVEEELILIEAPL